MKTLDDILKRSDNNFDLIRLIAALMVLFFHTFYLFDYHNHQLPDYKYLAGNSPGNLSVDVFFLLSGIFITSSFVNAKKHLLFYFTARIQNLAGFNNLHHCYSVYCRPFSISVFAK